MITYNDCIECEYHIWVYNEFVISHECQITDKQIYFETNKNKKDLIVKKCPKIKKRIKK